MKELAESLVNAAEDRSQVIDDLAEAIIRAVLDHQRSQRWVAKFLKTNGVKISHATIARRLKFAEKNWRSVLDEFATGDAVAGRRVDVNWLSATCVAFRSPKGTFWVRTEAITSIQELQDEGKRLVSIWEIAGLIVIEPTAKGFALIPKRVNGSSKIKP